MNINEEIHLNTKGSIIFYHHIGRSYGFTYIDDIEKMFNIKRNQLNIIEDNESIFHAEIKMPNINLSLNN